jgi:hypothetical protein
MGRRGLAVFGALLLAATLLSGTPARATGVVTGEDLQAISNALGFLGELSHGAPITVAVVYAFDAQDAKLQAAQTAATLNTIAGPNHSTFRSEILAVKDLAQTTNHYDVVLLMPSTMSQGAILGEIARRKRLVTISTSPVCIETHCCVLMVNADGRVQIVLDTALADLVDAHFSSVFEMMVERR